MLKPYTELSSQLFLLSPFFAHLPLEISFKLLKMSEVAISKTGGRIVRTLGLDFEAVLDILKGLAYKTRT